MVRGLALLGEISPRRAEILPYKHIKEGQHQQQGQTFGVNALFVTHFNPQQKEVVTDVNMSGPLARASPPDKLSCQMGMKTRPSKRASPLGRTGRV